MTKAPKEVLYICQYVIAETDTLPFTMLAAFAAALCILAAVTYRKRA